MPLRGQGHHVVFFGTECLTVHLFAQEHRCLLVNLTLGDNLAMDKRPILRETEIFLVAIAYATENPDKPAIWECLV